MLEPVRKLLRPAAAGSDLPRAEFKDMKDHVEAIRFSPPEGMPDFYPGPNIGAPELGRKFREGTTEYVDLARELLGILEPDSYTTYLKAFYADGVKRFGTSWGYADIVTTLLGLADELQPKSYLEIGVRRGRSACAVGWRAPKASMVFFDKWVKNYAGMDNPGPELVKAELAKVGHSAPVEFIDGNSHETLPHYFAENPNASFDIITVDGDHSDHGAAQDIADVIPHLKIGGALVFDDIAHPTHPGLRGVWREVVELDGRFSVYNYESVGYGIGFAIRRF